MSSRHLLVLTFVSTVFIFVTSMQPDVAQVSTGKKAGWGLDEAPTNVKTNTETKQQLLRQRIVDAIRGAFVADAASMGTHWHYSVDELMNLLPDVEAPEFKNPPTPNYYDAEDYPGHYGVGMLSPYGESLLFVTEHCACTKDIEGDAMSTAMMDWANTFGGRLDHATQQFLENMSKEDGSGRWPNCGADDDQAHCFMKAVPVTCMYAGKPELNKKVEEAIRVHQNNEKAVAFGLAASCILEAVLTGSTIGEALHQLSDIMYEPYSVHDAVKTGQNGVSKSLSDLLGELGTAGRSCLLPPSFIGPIQQLSKAAEASPDTRDLFMQAIRDNIRAGGDTCSRGILVGAIIAAATGGPPRSWVDKVDKAVMDKIDVAANAIADVAMEGISE